MQSLQRADRTERQRAQARVVKNVGYRNSRVQEKLAKKPRELKLRKAGCMLHRIKAVPADYLLCETNILLRFNVVLWK
jgi:hypothetical protein